MAPCVRLASWMGSAARSEIMNRWAVRCVGWSLLAREETVAAAGSPRVSLMAQRAFDLTTSCALAGRGRTAALERLRGGPRRSVPDDRGHALSCLGARGVCIARTMRKPNRARLRSDAALLLFRSSSGCWFATFPIKRARSAGRSHSCLASSTQRASCRRSSARPGVRCCPPNSFRGSTCIV